MANTTLRYKQSRDIKKVFTDVVNKIFALNTQWLNESVEVISLTGGNSPKAYEQYPWDNEQYPIVVLFSQGAGADLWGFNSIVDTHRQLLTAGTVPRTWVTLSTNPIATGIRLEQGGSMKLKAARLKVQNIGPYEENITINLWSASGGEPLAILSSGSIKGKGTTGIEWIHGQMSPEITLDQNTNYFFSAETVSTGSASGSYYWFVDNDVDTGKTPYSNMGVYNGVTWAMTADSSPMVEIYGPAVRRLGGGIQSEVRMFIEAKDLSTVQKITELLFVYLHLARHANVERGTKLTDPNVTSTDYDFVSDLSDEGIYIININKGAETVRVRGNDRLFSTDLSITCYSHWTEDFLLPVIEVLDFDFSSI